MKVPFVSHAHTHTNGAPKKMSNQSFISDQITNSNPPRSRELVDLKSGFLSLFNTFQEIEVFNQEHGL